MTEEETKELGELCGFRKLPMGKRGYHFEQTEKVMNWMPPDAKEAWESVAHLPRIDLDNLFKYAVPKIWEAGSVVAMIAYPDNTCECEVITRRETPNSFAKGKDPAEALAQAILKALRKK